LNPSKFGQGFKFDETLASQIKKLLQKEDATILENDIKLAPSWIARELFNLFFLDSS
jgi:hypothetical protein